MDNRLLAFYELLSRLVHADREECREMDTVSSPGVLLLDDGGLVYSSDGTRE